MSLGLFLLAGAFVLFHCCIYFVCVCVLRFLVNDLN